MSSESTCEFVPYLSVTNANEAVEFYSRVFKVARHVRLDMPDGRVMHCEFRVGGTRFFSVNSCLRKTGKIAQLLRHSSTFRLEFNFSRSTLSVLVSRQMRTDQTLK